MSNNAPITIQLLRGVFALAAITGAIVFANVIWAVVPLVLLAVVLMRGCPMCWLSGLFAAIAVHRAGKSADSHHTPHLGQ